MEEKPINRGSYEIYQPTAMCTGLTWNVIFKK